MRVIDCHIHVWRAADRHPIAVREKIAALSRNREIADFAAVAAVQGAVVIEAAETVDETIDLCARLSGQSLVGAVVGWVDLASGDVGETLDRLVEFPLFRGVRALPAFGERDASTLTSQFLDGLAALAKRRLSLDILATPRQLDVLPRVADACPDLPMILNHGGRPLVMCGVDATWTRAIRRVARETTACCKLSGLIERAGFEWTIDTLRPFVGELVEAFGPSRLAFASNWPMVELTGTHHRWSEAVEQLLDDFGLSAGEKASVFFGTASAVYRLETPPADRRSVDG